MLYSRILAFVALAAIAHSAPTLRAKDPDRKGVIAAFEVGASTAKMAAENEALKTENEALKAMLKAKNHESEPVTGLEVHKEQEGGGDWQEGGGDCPPPLCGEGCGNRLFCLDVVTEPGRSTYQGVQETG